MPDDIKSGNVVRLTSGGPLMTVANVRPTQQGIMEAWCEWFTGDEKHQEKKGAAFALTSLQKIS
jgi:uncharacterized protein YodC (DUF2158 family)